MFLKGPEAGVTCTASPNWYPLQEAEVLCKEIVEDVCQGRQQTYIRAEGDFTHKLSNEIKTVEQFLLT